MQPSSNPFWPHPLKAMIAVGAAALVYEPSYLKHYVRRADEVIALRDDILHRFGEELHRVVEFQGASALPREGHFQLEHNS